MDEKKWPIRREEIFVCEICYCLVLRDRKGGHEDYHRIMGWVEAVKSAEGILG